jgi:hypothetical protein
MNTFSYFHYSIQDAQREGKGMSRLSFERGKIFIQPPVPPSEEFLKTCVTTQGYVFNTIASPASTIQYTVLSFESTPVSSESSALTTTRPWLFAD